MTRSTSCTTTLRAVLERSPKTKVALRVVRGAWRDVPAWCIERLPDSFSRMSPANGAARLTLRTTRCWISALTYARILTQRYQQKAQREGRKNSISPSAYNATAPRKDSAERTPAPPAPPQQPPPNSSLSTSTPRPMHPVEAVRTHRHRQQDRYPRPLPLVLDVRQFSTPEIRVDSTSKRRSNPDPEAYLYDLFTVVVHEGSMNTGHYTNFCKWRAVGIGLTMIRCNRRGKGGVGGKGVSVGYRRRLLKNVVSGGSSPGGDGGCRG